ncbi:uncharacterized protein V1518DRAFT_411842 [Limtongia smithiae]|uniref:uncharacterized protein n=1 Tax=Limtongia smithiae TaxID=1125753 RepID=UPI0034CFD36C
MPPPGDLRAALAAVSTRFPASLTGLHARAALALATLDPFHPIRIALLPFEADRRDTKRIMDSLILLEAPVPYRKLAANEREWHRVVCNRGLGKDSRVHGGPYLEETITNYMQTFTAPSTFLIKHNITLVESMRQPRTVDDLYETCHFHLFVSTALSSLALPLPETIVPALRVLDVDSVDAVQAANSAVQDSAVVISTKAAEALLPVEDAWAEKSKITDLAAVLSDRAMIMRRLVVSILETCEEYVCSSRAYIQSATTIIDPKDDKRDVAAARKAWAKEAHTELRDVLGTSLLSFERRVAWWKLYWVTDDIEQVVARETVLAGFLPRAERRLVYLVGQLNGLSAGGAKPLLPAEEVGTCIGRTRNSVRDELLPALHATAQRLITTTFIQMQLPLAAVAAAGWQWLDFTTYSAGGLALFGAVWGFRRVQRKWDAAVAEFVRETTERAAAAAAEGESEIFRAWEARVAEMRATLDAQAAVGAGLRKGLEEEL